MYRCFWIAVLSLVLFGSQSDATAEQLSSEKRLLGVDDALPADDRLAVSIQSHAPPQMVLLTRDRADQIPSAGYYAERALASMHTLEGIWKDK